MMQGPIDRVLRQSRSQLLSGLLSLGISELLYVIRESGYVLLPPISPPRALAGSVVPDTRHCRQLLPEMITGVAGSIRGDGLHRGSHDPLRWMPCGRGPLEAGLQGATSDTPLLPTTIFSGLGRSASRGSGERPVAPRHGSCVRTLAPLYATRCHGRIMTWHLFGHSFHVQGFIAHTVALRNRVCRAQVVVLPSAGMHSPAPFATTVMHLLIPARGSTHSDCRGHAFCIRPLSI